MQPKVCFFAKEATWGETLTLDTVQFLFQCESFGTHGCSLKYASLPRRQHGEKLLTLDQVQRRGWSLVNRCYLCQLEEESIDHIFLHCVKTKVL